MKNDFHFLLIIEPTLIDFLLNLVDKRLALFQILTMFLIRHSTQPHRIIITFFPLEK